MARGDARFSVRRLRQSQLVLGFTCDPELATTGLKPPSAQQLPEARSRWPWTSACLSRLARRRSVLVEHVALTGRRGRRSRRIVCSRPEGPGPAPGLPSSAGHAPDVLTRPALFSLGAQGATGVFRSAGRRLASTPSRRLRPTRNCGTTPCVHMRLGALRSFFSFSPVAFFLGVITLGGPGV